MTTTSELEGKERMSQKKHGFLRAIGWFFAVCIALELVLRLFGYGSYTLYRPDERLLWVPLPGRTLTVVNHLPITINDQGFRYPVDVKPKQAGEFRVIAFGDSSTQGWGVDDNSTYSAQLEKLLSRTSCGKQHFEVIDAGVNAYPNALVAEKLKEVLEDNVVQPDIAIFAYSYNSNFEKLTKLQGKAREDFLRRVWFKGIVRRSALYNFTIEGVLRRLVYYNLRHVLMAGTLSSEGGMEALDMDYYHQALEQSVELSRAHHVQLIFLMLGSKGQVMNKDMFPFQTAMLDFAEKEHVPIVNMIPIASSKNQDDVFLDPVHPSVAGHELIAEQLLQTVQALPPYQAACRNENASTLAATSSPGH